MYLIFSNALPKGENGIYEVNVHFFFTDGLSENTRGLLKIQSMACLADHYRTDLCPCV